MNDTPLLYTLFEKNTLGRANPARRIIEACLQGTPLDKDLMEQALTFASVPITDIPSYSAAIDRWREIFSLIAILHIQHALQPFKQRLTEGLLAIRESYPFKELQLATAYDAYCSYLLGIHCKEPACESLSGGACPVEEVGYGLFSETPNPLLHAELGVIWSLYGHATANKRILEAAASLAEWQLNTLDHLSVPFAGLMSPEGEASIPSLAIINTLLFNAVAHYAGKSEFSVLAKKQSEIATAFASQERIVIPPHVIVTSLLMKDASGFISEAVMPFSETIMDESLAIAGARSPTGSGVVTLFGSRSGMGCYHTNTARILSYGPQHFPLGDCKGYGLEGGARFLSSELKQIVSSQGECTISGIARLSSLPLKDKGAKPSGVSGIWIDSTQSVTREGLSVKGIFQQVYEESPLAFSFFLQCDECVIGNEKKIRRRSFDKYQGKPETIIVECGKEKFELIMKGDCKEMHIIPLGGGTNFWGADYLVAFLPRGNGAEFSFRFAKEKD